MSPSIQDVYDQLVAVNGHLTDVHADLVAVVGATDAVRTSVDAVDATAVTGFTVLSQDLAVVATLQAQAVTVLDQLSRQQDTVICSLDQIARTTCALLDEAHEQTALQRRGVEDLSALRAMFATVHPDAALALHRQAELERRIEHCCPPEQPEPPCTYEPCPRPEPIDLPVPDPTVPPFPHIDPRKGNRR